MIFLEITGHVGPVPSPGEFFNRLLGSDVTLFLFLTLFLFSSKAQRRKEGKNSLRLRAFALKGTANFCRGLRTGLD